MRCSAVSTNRRTRLDDALQEYEAAVRIRPDMSQAQLDLGAMLAKKGDIAGATEHLRQASGSADPTPAANRASTLASN